MLFEYVPLSLVQYQYLEMTNDIYKRHRQRHGSTLNPAYLLISKNTINMVEANEFVEWVVRDLV
jgi:hypothetical protein